MSGNFVTVNALYSPIGPILINPGVQQVYYYPK